MVKHIFYSTESCGQTIKLALATLTVLGVVGFASQGALADEAGSIAEAGAKIYANRCVVCHQVDGTGMGEVVAGNLNKPEIQAKTDAELMKSIKFGANGRIGNMPAWGDKLSDEDIKSVVLYIRGTYGPKQH